MKQKEIIQIPTDDEIHEAERLVETMKAARDQAKNAILASLKSIDDLPSFLSGEDMIRLMNALSRKLQAGHKKVRGSKVPDELKRNLEYALKQGEFTISQLEKIFNLSTSYIIRVKNDLGLTKAHHRGQQAVAAN